MVKSGSDHLRCCPVVGGPVACQGHENSRVVRRDHGSRDDGFTLIELLIVIVILPLVVGAIAVSLLAIFKNQSTISNRLTSSGDAQVMSSSYFPDLQSSTQFTTQSTSSPQCGSGSQVIGVEWQGTANTLNLVSYTVAGEGNVNGVTSYGIQRVLCTGVSTTQTGVVTPTAVSSLATNIPSPNVVPLVTGLSCSAATTACAPAASSAAQGWTSAVGVQSVQLTVHDVGTSGSGGWSFSLGSGPRAWLPLTTVGCISSPTCVAGWFLSGPSTLLDVNKTGAPTKLNGHCDVNVPSIGLNSGTVTVDGNDPNLYSSLSGTTIYGSNGQTISTHQGSISTVSGTFTDPFAGLTPATLTSSSITGFPSIVNLGITWPRRFSLVGGTIYVIDNSTLPSGPSPIPGSNGSSSVIIWDTVTGRMQLNGNATLDLGPNGILYAPNGTLTFDGGSVLQGSNVILNNMKCDGGGNSPASLILTRRP